MGKLKVYKVIAVCLVLMTLTLVVQSSKLSEAKSEAERQRRNVESLTSAVSTFRASNGELIAKVNDLELTKKEFNRMFAEDAELINSLKRRNEELNRIVKAGIQTKVEVQTIVKDSIIYVEGKREEVEVLEWEDPPWESLKATIYDDKVADVRMSHTDNIDVVVFLDFKRFLFWKTKLKGCNVDVVSHNPYTESMDVSSISIVK